MKTSLLFLSFLLLTATAFAQSANWNYASNFPGNGFINQFDTSGVHSLAVDGDGKVWFQLWSLTNETQINNETVLVSSVFVFNEDGTESNISPINFFSLDGDTTYFTENNARGMSADQNGDIIISYGQNLFKVNHVTGEGIAKFESPSASSLTKSSVADNGNVVVGHVFPDLPVYLLNTDLNIIENVVNSRSGFARTVEISKDANDVFIFKHTEQKIELYTFDSNSEQYLYSRDFLTGISGESSIIYNEKLWVGGGHINDPHQSGSGFENYTWYEFDLNSETVTNEIKWNFDGQETDVRPRGIAFSEDGQKTYLAQFFGDGESIIQEFQLQNEPDNVVSISELNSYENLDEYSVAGLQNHPLAGIEVTYTGVIISNPKSSGLASSIDSDGDSIIDDISRIHIFITDTAAVHEGREGMSIQITESDWELLDTLEIGDVVTFTGELTFFNATSQMTVNAEPIVLGTVFGEFPEFSELLEPWEVSIDDLNIVNDDGTEEINFSNYTKYNGSYVKVNGVSVSDVTNSTRPVWSLNSGTSKIFIYDHSLRVRNDRNEYLEGWNYRRDTEEDFTAPEVGSIANVSGFLAITNYGIPNLASNKDVFTFSPFEDGFVWIDGIRYEDGDDIGDGEILDWPNDIEVVAGPVGENSYNLDVNFKVNMAVQQEVENFDPQTQNVLISGSFNSWSTSQDTLSLDSDTTYSIMVTVPNQMVGDSLKYKFILVNDDGEITWENRQDRGYYLNGIEPDLDLDGTRDITLNHFFDDEGYEITENEDLEILFSVDMSVQEVLGNFNSDLQSVRITGSFNGWSTANLPLLTNESESIYSTKIIVNNVADLENIYYKFVIEDNEEIIFEEPDGIINPNIQDDRIYTSSGLEQDSDGDGIRDIELETVLFGDEATVEKLRELELGYTVRFKGLVTRALGRVSMIQDELFGIATFDLSGDYFTAIGDGSITQGDSLQIFGTLSEFNGLRQISVITGYEVLSRNNEMPTPQEVSLADIDEDFESEIIKVTGLSVNTSDVFFQNSTTYELSIDEITDTTVALRIQSTSDTELGGVEIPSEFEFVGVVGQFSPTGNDGYQLVPVNVSDITAIDSSSNNDQLEITFKVDMSAQEEDGNFNPDSSTAQLAGNFTGWSTPVDMEASDSLTYQLIHEFTNPVPGDTLFYKFVYTKGNSIIYEDPNPEISEVATEFNNRFYVITGNEIDTNEDGRKDVSLDRVFFSDDDGSIPLGESIALSMDSVFAFITDTITITISISGLAELPMSAFEIEFSYDTNLLDIELAEDQSGTLAESFLMESNKPQGGSIVISGASTTAVDTDGDLLVLTIYPQSAGSGSINATNLKINEDVELVDLASSQVNIIERLCGDVTNDMTISTLDATFVLRHTVFLSPQYPLIGLDSLAADVTGNGDISAFDASKILQFEVGFIDELGCNPENAKKQQLFTKANWNLYESESDIVLSIDLSATDFDIYSAQLELDISEGLSFKEMKDLERNWQVLTNQVDGKTKISMFGVQPLNQKELELVVLKDREFLNSAIKGAITLNESNGTELTKLVVNTLPKEFSLSQNYPNPFNPSTNIEFSLPEQSIVRLTIFNMLGQKVATLANERKEAGVYTVNWNASSVASGVYFYRLNVGNKVFTKRMMLIK